MERNKSKDNSRKATKPNIRTPTIIPEVVPPYNVKPEGVVSSSIIRPKLVLFQIGHNKGVSYYRTKQRLNEKIIDLKYL